MVESVNSLRTFLPTQLWHSVWILQCCVNLYKIFPLDCTPKVLNTLPIGLRPSPVHSWRLRNSELWPPFWPLHQGSNQCKVHRAIRGRVGDETTRSLATKRKAAVCWLRKHFLFPGILLERFAVVKKKRTQVSRPLFNLWVEKRKSCLLH